LILGCAAGCTRGEPPQSVVDGAPRADAESTVDAGPVDVIPADAWDPALLVTGEASATNVLATGPLVTPLGVGTDIFVTAVASNGAHDAVSFGPGVFEIPDVPQEAYWLHVRYPGAVDGSFAPLAYRLADEWILTSSRTPHLDPVNAGRSSPDESLDATLTTGPVTMMTPWASDDGLGLYSVDLNVASSWQAPTLPAASDTTANVTFTYCPGLLVAGDDLTLLHYGRQPGVSGWLIETAILHAAATIPFENTTLTGGAFRALLLDRRLTTELDGASFVSSSAGSFVSATVAVEARPPLAPSGVSLAYDYDTTGTLAASMAFDDPFSSFDEYWSSYVFFGDTQGNMVDAIFEVDQLPAPATIPQFVAAPTNVTVDGVALAAASTIHGGSVIAWTAPPVGTWTDFRIILRNATASRFASIMTDSTSVTLPPGLIVAGDDYGISVQTELFGSVDFQSRPLTIGYPLGVGEAAASPALHAP
jgi:hypothetical protein